MKVDQELFGDPLPTYLTRFVGRAQELSTLTALVGSARLVTICGVGGSGKSRLAVEFARRLNGEPGRGGFADGVVWVPLTTVAEASAVPGALAAALGLQEASSGQPTNALRRTLANQQVLVVLDNCEQVTLACAALLDELLPGCPTVSVLATSRQPLQCDAEELYPIPPLGLSTYGQGKRDAGDAVSMFIDRATMTSPAYALTEANAETVHDICERLEGLPLAIELVASWIRVLSPRDLLANLRDGDGVLSSTNAPVAERHRSIQSVLHSSWAWLADEDRRVLSALGVFHGGFDRAAAAAVAGASLASLSALTERSLIQRMPDSAGGSRYHIHELVRDYAVQRLAGLGAEAVAQLRARHFDYFLGLVERADAAWDTDDEQCALLVLEADPANVDAALVWAIDAGQADRALRMAAGMFSFVLYTRRQGGSTTALLARAVDLPWEPSSPTAIRARARALNVAGYAAVSCDFEKAAPRFAEAMALAERVDDLAMVAWSLRGISYIKRLTGHFAAAEADEQRSLALCRQIGDHPGIAWSRYDLGEIAFARGRFDEALSLTGEGIRSFEQLGIGYGFYRAQLLLGELHLQRDMLEPALAAFSRGLEFQQRRHFVTRCPEILEGVAAVAARLHRYQLAATLLGAGNSWREAFTLPHLSGLQPSYPSVLRSTCRELGAETFQEAYGTGESMTSAQSVDRLGTAIAELSDGLSGLPSGLTAREVEVLRLVALGLSNAELAERLVVSPRTVHAHLRSIFDKLGVATRTAAAHEAVRIGVA